MDTTISAQLGLVLGLTKVQAIINREMDARLCAHGLSYNDFIILHYLSQSEGKKLRRIDLAQMVGVTASGITRMLAPMEKIGLISRESNERDARISYVVLARGGKRLYEDATTTAEYVAETMLSALKTKKIESLAEAFSELTDNI